MKKIFCLLSGITLCCGFNSCVKDGYEEFTRSFSAEPINIITNLQNGTTTVSTGGVYQFDLNITKFTGVISTNNLIINNNSWNFTTQESPFMSVDTYNALFTDPIGDINNNNSLPLNNSTFLGTPYFNYTTKFAGDYTFYPEYGYILASSYQIGDSYLVRTFQEDTFYAGETTTTYPSANGLVTANPEGIIYRIHLDLEKNTAALIIYNAKFSNVPAEPVKEVIIAENLKVDFSENGIVISGENIIPEVGEAEATTPYPSFIFNNIRFETTNDILTECKITYQVAGIYNGEFTGSYVLETLPDDSGSNQEFKN